MKKFYLSPTDRLIMVSGPEAWAWSETSRHWIKANNLAAEVTGHGGAVFNDIRQSEAEEKFPDAFKIVDDSA